MELSHAVRVEAPVGDAVIDAIRDPRRWSRWLPAEVGAPEGDEVKLVWRGPRPIRTRLALRPMDHGVAWSLVEGDVGTEGSVEVVDGEVRWTVRIDVPVVLPGPLVRALRDELLPALTVALVRTAGESSDYARSSA